MEKLAIDIEPTRTSSRTAGFNTITKVQRKERVDDDEDKGEVARIR